MVLFEICTRIDDNWDNVAVVEAETPDDAVDILVNKDSIERHWITSILFNNTDFVRDNSEFEHLYNIFDDAIDRNLGRQYKDIVADNRDELTLMIRRISKCFGSKNTVIRELEAIGSESTNSKLFMVQLKDDDSWDDLIFIYAEFASEAIEALIQSDVGSWNRSWVFKILNVSLEYHYDRESQLYQTIKTAYSLGPEAYVNMIKEKGGEIFSVLKFIFETANEECYLGEVEIVSSKITKSANKR